MDTRDYMLLTEMRDLGWNGDADEYESELHYAIDRSDREDIRRMMRESLRAMRVRETQNALGHLEGCRCGECLADDFARHEHAAKVRQDARECARWEGNGY